jgi:hypothetical protein
VAVEAVALQLVLTTALLTTKQKVKVEVTMLPTLLEVAWEASHLKSSAQW